MKSMGSVWENLKIQLALKGLNKITQVIIEFPVLSFVESHVLCWLVSARVRTNFQNEGKRYSEKY